MKLAFLAIAVAAIAVLAAAVPGSPPRARADIAPPRNFVSLVDCTSLSDADVVFVIPGTIDLANKLGVQPRAIWIDLSLQDNDFAPGTFIAAGPFVSTTEISSQVYNWPHVLRDRTHFYRVNALMADGHWREVGGGTFRTPDCAPLTMLYCEFTGEAVGTVGARFEVGPQSFGTERPAIEFWIDLSIFSNPLNPELDNAFPPGTFFGAGPFPPGGATFDWHGMINATRHYSRVNVLHGGPPLVGSRDNWGQTLGSRFTTLDCRDLPRMSPGAI